MSSSAFVSQLYTQLFNRDGDTEGLAFWVEEIDSGRLNAAQVTQNFIDSAEFADVITPVVQLYFSVLGRTPDTEGLKLWSQQLQRGDSLEAISASMMASDEYQQQYGGSVGDNSAFLDQLYNNALNRTPDSTGKTYWLEALDSGQLSQAQVVVAFLDSDEAQTARSDEISVIGSHLASQNTIPAQEDLDTGVAEYRENAVGYITRNYASDNYDGVTVPGLSKDGVAVDGYVSGATVTLTVIEEINGELVTRTETRVTDENGHFDFGEDAGFGTMVMTGGTDISTGAVFEGSMSAPAGAKVINPLTTLINGLSQQADAPAGSAAIAAANQQVLEKFDLPDTLDLLNYDPIQTAIDATNSAAAADALAVQSAAAQTNTLLTQIAAVLDGLDIVEDELAGEQAAQTALVSMLAQPEQLDLSDANTIATLSQQAATGANATETQQQELDALISDSSDAIAQLNQAIKTAATTSSSATEGLGNIAQVQVVAEELEEQLEAAVAQQDLSSVLEATRDDALNNAIAEQEDNINVGSDNGAVYTPPPPPAPPKPTPTPTPTPSPGDTTAPTISSAQLNADGDIEITWSEAPGQASVAEVADYTVTVGGNAIAISSASLDSNVVTLTPTGLLSSSATIDSIAYSRTGGTADSIIDVSGNAAEDQTITTVPNNSGPSLSSIAINADGNLEVTWSEDISGSNAPGAHEYDIIVGGQSLTVSSAAFKSGANDTVTLTMASPLAADTVIEAVVFNGYYSVRDSDNNAALYGMRYDEKAPELIENTSAISSAAPGASVITLEFNEEMAVGTGNITLDDGAGGQQVIDVTSGKVVIGNDKTKVIVQLDTPLAESTSYTVDLDESALTDTVGNAAEISSDTSELSFTTGVKASDAGTDSTVVIFDMVNGVSSDHSGRTFDANTSYNIYVRFGATDQSLNTVAQSGAASNATFSQWIGAENLGSDDKIWFATDTGAMPVRSGSPADTINLGIYSGEMEAFYGAGNSVAVLNGAGTITRYDTSNDKIDLWLGEISVTQNMVGTSLASNINTLLGTQGLL